MIPTDNNYLFCHLLNIIQTQAARTLINAADPNITLTLLRLQIFFKASIIPSSYPTSHAMSALLSQHSIRCLERITTNQKRLYSLLTSSSSLASIVSCNIIDIPWSDHKAILIYLLTYCIKTLDHRWSLNNSGIWFHNLIKMIKFFVRILYPK